MVGTINGQGQVEKVQTWIDQSIVGDMLVETTYSGYRNFGGVTFPSRIVQTQDGYPSLDLTISSVTANPMFDAPVPDNVRNAPPPAGADGRRREAGRRRLLSDRRLAPQPGDRDARSHRRRRHAAERSARAGRAREGEGNHPEQADPLRRDVASPLGSSGRHPDRHRRGRHDRDAPVEQGVPGTRREDAAHARPRSPRRVAESRADSDRGRPRPADRRHADDRAAPAAELRAHRRHARRLSAEGEDPGRARRVHAAGAERHAHLARRWRTRRRCTPTSSG